MMKYRLKGNPAVECERGCAYYGSTSLGFLTTYQWDSMFLAMPESLFDLIWEPVPETPEEAFRKALREAKPGDYVPVPDGVKSSTAYRICAEVVRERDDLDSASAIGAEVLAAIYEACGL